MVWMSTLSVFTLTVPSAPVSLYITELLFILLNPFLYFSSSRWQYMQFAVINSIVIQIIATLLAD